MYDLSFKSSLMILETLEREIFNARANFRAETVLFPLNRRFAVWLVSFVRTIRGQPVGPVRLIVPVSLIILHHLLMVL